MGEQCGKYCRRVSCLYIHVTPLFKYKNCSCIKLFDDLLFHAVNM